MLTNSLADKILSGDTDDLSIPTTIAGQQSLLDSIYIKLAESYPGDAELVAYKQKTNQVPEEEINDYIIRCRHVFRFFVDYNDSLDFITSMIYMSEYVKLGYSVPPHYVDDMKQWFQIHMGTFNGIRDITSNVPGRHDTELSKKTYLVLKNKDPEAEELKVHIRSLIKARH